MATKRRPPPKKQPSPPPPPPPPHSDDEVDEDVRSSSEEEPEVEQDRKPLESEASDDDGEETGGDETGEDEDDSESETEQLAPNPPRPRDDDAGDEDDDDGDTDESGEEDSESEEEQPNLSSQNPNVARPAEANGNPSGEKSLPVSESEEEDSESEEVITNLNPRSSAVTHLANVHGNPSDKKSVHVSQSGEDDSESEEEPPNPSPRNAAIANENLLDKKSVPASDSVKVAATPLKAATGETAKKLFQRIWSDEDQIALLQGMVDYVGKKAKDPVANIEDFGLFIRKKLSFPVTQSQLMSKINTVRKKYRSRSKSINQGKESTFRKYDAEVFELSTKVWGAVKNGENGGVKKGKGVKNGENGGVEKRKGVPLDKEAVRDSPSNELLIGMPWDDEVINLCKEHFGCDEYSAIAKMNSMEESEWKSLLPRWKKLKMDEVRCFENRRSLEVNTLETIFNSS